VDFLGRGFCFLCVGFPSRLAFGGGGCMERSAAVAYVVLVGGKGSFLFARPCAFGGLCLGGLVPLDRSRVQWLFFSFILSPGVPVGLLLEISFALHSLLGDLVISLWGVPPVFLLLLGELFLWFQSFFPLAAHDFSCLLLLFSFLRLCACFDFSFDFSVLGSRSVCYPSTTTTGSGVWFLYRDSDAGTQDHNAAEVGREPFRSYRVITHWGFRAFLPSKESSAPAPLAFYWQVLFFSNVLTQRMSDSRRP